MKRLLVLILSLFICMFVFGQTDSTAVASNNNFASVLLSNWGIVLAAFLAFVKVIISLTPSIEDDKLFGYIDDFFNIFVKNRTK